MDVDTEKKKRKRLKDLCKKIRGQMEFYFSDANLHKDRFLKQQIDKSTDGWLSIDLFSNFNKLKKLTPDLELVAKALKTSELIEVSEDGKRIKRKVPLSDPKDVDERTIYVEHLPPDAHHESVKSMFTPFGKVLYVSIPKYQSTKDIKGFAFVEFESAESVQKACDKMNNQAVDPTDNIGKFPVKGCRQIQKMQKQLSAQKGKRESRKRTVSETAVIDRKAEDAKEEMLKKSGRKRTRLWSQGSDQGSDVKKLKTDKDDNSSSDDSSSDSENEQSSTTREQEQGKGDGKDINRKRKLEDQSGNVNNENETKKLHTTTDDKNQEKSIGEIPVKSAEKEKKRKRKRKSKPKEEKNTLNLRVIPKNEWTLLRSEYIKLQKSNMADLKTSLKKLKTDDIQGADSTCMDVSNGNSIESPEGKNINKKVDKSAKGKVLEFQPDVIVYVKSTKSLIRKDLKDQLCTFGDIAYIDVLDGDQCAHIRCATPDAASGIAKASVEQLEFTVLQGEEEKSYWDKILSDREKKLNSKSKGKKRGKDKAIGRVEMMKEAINKKTHVHFDDT